MLGNMDSYDSFCRKLANLEPCLVVSVAYHVAPEHRFPEPLEDCYAACLWARQHAAELGGISGPLALAKIQAAWLLALESIYRITRDNNQGGQTIGWLNTWVEGRHAQMQSDLSVMISPALFDEFVYPELKEQSTWMDKALYHFDGAEQMKHLDKLLALDTLHMIQWTCVEGQPEPMYYIDALKKVQAAGKGILILAKPEWIEPLMTGLSSRGLYLVSTASSVVQAEELIALVWGSGYFLEDERTVDVRSATCARSWSPTRPGRATFVRFGVSGTNSCRTVRSLMLRNLNAPAKES